MSFHKQTRKRDGQYSQATFIDLIFFHFLSSMQFWPPEYKVENMQTPTALFSGLNDKLASPKDVELLRQRLTNMKYFKEIEGWNHVDFLFGNDAPQLLYSKILNMIETDLTLGENMVEFQLFDEKWAELTELISKYSFF